MNRLDIDQVAALAPGTAVLDKGRARVHEILTAAVDILAYEGYSAFTMRAIAARCGITLRNLQYYFKTKADLFRAVVELRLAEDLASARAVIERADLSAEERFLAFVDLSIEENTSALVRGFQFELWARANRDPFAASCRDRMTKAYCEFIYQLIRPLSRGDSPAALREKAAILLATLQGVALVVGRDTDVGVQATRIRRRLRTEALQFAKDRKT
jgi:AcrR family transcriptional regulator